MMAMTTPSVRDGKMTITVLPSSQIMVPIVDEGASDTLL